MMCANPYFLKTYLHYLKSDYQKVYKSTRLQFTQQPGEQSDSNYLMLL